MRDAARPGLAGAGRAVALLLGVVAIAAHAQPVAAQGRDRQGSATDEAERARAMAMLQRQPEARERHYREALEAAFRGVAANARDALAWLLAGRAFVGLNDYVGADSAFARATALRPQYAEEVERERERAWAEAYERGAAAFQENRYEESIAHFEAATRIHGKWPHAHVTLGWLYANQGDTEKARAAYAGALEIIRRGVPPGQDEEQRADWDRNHEAAALGLGELLMATGRAAEAVEVYREFLASHPDHPQASAALAVALAVQVGEAADSVSAQVLAREDLDEAQLHRIGATLFASQRYAEAATAFRRALELNPYSRDAYFNLGQALYLHVRAITEGQGGQAGAKADLRALYAEMRMAAERMLELDPQNARGYSLLAHAHRGLAETAPDAAARSDATVAMAAAVRAAQALTFDIVDVSGSFAGDRLVLSGTLQNLKLDAGEEVRLRFSVLGPDGSALDSQVVTVRAPEPQQAVTFEVALAAGGDVKGWKYEVVP